MFVYRGAVCAGLDRLLERGRRGHGGALVITGEPGMGRTSLLRHARDRASGMQVLDACGVAAESDIAYAGLHELVRPVLPALSRLPDPQRAALAGALALGPPAAVDRFAVGAAALSVLVGAGASTPVLVLVDDIHLMDGPSVEALSFAARRLVDDPAVMIFSALAGPPVPPGLAHLPTVRLDGLGASDGAQLLRRDEATVTDAVAARLVAQTGGNPRALSTLASLLSSDQLRGREPLRGPLPIDGELATAFARPVLRLPPATRRALLILAASEVTSLETLEPAFDAVACLVTDLEAAERAAVVAITGGRATFAHPLMRSALYHVADATQRRAAHVALGEALDGPRTPEEEERRAWHLADATMAPSEPVAAALEAAAGHTRDRHGHVAAATTLERAARLTPERDVRARRLLAAGGAAASAGRTAFALELLDEAADVAGDPLARADVDLLRGSLRVWRGAPRSGCSLLTARAQRVETTDPVRASLLWNEAAAACLLAGDTAAALRDGTRAETLCPPNGRGSPPAQRVLWLALTRILRGEGPRGLALLDRCRARVRGTDAAALAWGYLAADCLDEATRILEGAVRVARGSVALGQLPLLLGLRSLASFRTGDWPAAHAQARESVELAEEAGRAADLAVALGALAQVEAGRGRGVETRAHATRGLQLCAQTGLRLLEVTNHAALGLLELGSCNTAEAVAHLERGGEFTRERGLGELAHFSWAPELVEAYVHEGRQRDARTLTDYVEQQALSSQRVFTSAVAARCRGLVAPPSEFEQHFVEALDWHRRVPRPFERARTELCFGARLRRIRRRAEARPQLRSAFATFDRLGAVDWAERARTELEATGERGRPHAHELAVSLTPQELQVALVVAGGATNREAAAKLFLSHKTVEYHLGNVYRKLETHSRERLRELFHVT